jgi:TolB-like protein
MLLAHAGQIVTPQQLRQALWGETRATADSIPKCMSSLGARFAPEEFIQTVYKRGYRFVGEVRSDGAGPKGTLARLAILPFATDYGVAEHLGPAIAEETIALLGSARPSIVSVLPKDSVFTLARRGLSAAEIGEKMKADLVLSGSLRSLSSHFRLRVEMIRTTDGSQIWVEDLLAERCRITGLESELANRLALRLNGGGLSICAVAAPAAQESDPEQREAYELFLRARHEWQTLQRHRMQDGLQHLLRATELDPSLLKARVELVHLCVAQAFYGFMSPAVAADIVRRAAEPVAELEHRAEALLPALGWIYFHVDHNLPAAMRAFSHSAHLAHDPWITRVRTMFALSRHRLDEAIEMLEAAIRVDCYSPWLQARLAWALHLAGEAAASVEQIRKTLELYPEHQGACLYGSLILAFNGEAARGTELAQDLAQRLPYFDLATAVHAYALASEGRGGEARTILERLQWLSRERFVLNSFTPAVHVALGDHEAALRELEASAESRCPWFFQMLADPRLKPLGGHPEFERMRGILAGMEAAVEREAELD